MLYACPDYRITFPSQLTFVVSICSDCFLLLLYMHALELFLITAWGLCWSDRISGFILVVYCVIIVESSYWKFWMCFFNKLWFRCFVFFFNMFIWESSCFEALIVNKPMISCIMVKRFLFACFFFILERFPHLQIYLISKFGGCDFFWNRRCNDFLKSQFSCQYVSATHYVKLV